MRSRGRARGPVLLRQSPSRSKRFACCAGFRGSESRPENAAIGSWSAGGHDFPHASTRQFDRIILRTIALLLSDLDTQGKMARYSAFLGRSVEVQYRAGDILLPASGTFVADSGRSIFLEQTVEQRGQHKHFRWEIPYQYLVRIEEKLPAEASVGLNTKTLPSAAPDPAASPS